MGNGASQATVTGPDGKVSRPPSARREEIRLKLRSVIDFLQIAHYGSNDLSLTEAVQLGFINEVRSILLNPNCDVNEHDEDGNTPVMHAAGLPPTLDDGLTSAQFVKLLLEGKANPNWQNTMGNTALHFACEDEDVHVISLLLLHGADIHLENDYGQSPADLCVTQATRDILDDFGDGRVPTPESATESGGGDAAVASEPKGMKRISSTGDVLTVATPIVLVRDVPSKATIDDCCKSKGTHDDVARLLRQKADPNEVDAKGSTPLMKAVWYENTGIIEALLEVKADVNKKNHRLNTALHFAFEKNNSQIIDLLVGHGGHQSLSEKNSLGKTPQDLSTMEYLRAKSREEEEQAAAEANARKEAKTHLALSNAVKAGDINEAARLIEAKADVNEKDHRGSTPLMHAVWPEDADVTELLLDNDADPNMQNLRLNTALHFAYEKDNEHIINLLLAYGGTMSLDVKNGQGKTPVQLTNSEYLRWETGEDVEAIEAEKAKKELQKAVKKAGKGALAAAAKKKDLEKVLMLLEGGADPNETNAKGSVPLMDAAWNRSCDIADALIKCRADVNVQNLRGNTALHFAFERNSKPMVHLLLSKGAEKSMQLKNTMGKKPPQLTTKQYLRQGAEKIVSSEKNLATRVTHESPKRRGRVKKKSMKDLDNS